MKRTAKTVFILIAGIIFIFSVVRLVNIALEGEKGRLKRTIYKAKRHAERENIVILTNYISPNYSDELGNDRRSLLLIAKNFFDEYKNILILINSLEVSIEEEKAAAHIEATVYWQEKDSEKIIYDTAEVEAKFKKENKQWRLIELKFFQPEKKRLFHPMTG